MSKDESSLGSSIDVVAAALALASSGGSGLAASAAILEFGRGLANWVAERRAKKCAEMLNAAYFANSSDYGALAEFAALLKSEDAKGVLVEALRFAEESIADEVLPALAMLMREYHREARPADAYFRGVCRTLRDLSGAQYALLRECVQHVAARSGDGSAIRRMKTPEGSYALEVTNVGVTIVQSVRLTAPANLAPEVFHLLDINGLGQAEQDLQSRAGGSTETHVILVSRSTAQRLAPLMGLTP